MQRTTVLCLVLLVSSVPTVGSSQVLRTFVSPNEEFQGWFGFPVASAGDVNNDGCDDVLVGAHFEDPGSSPSEAGRAYVFNGQTGALIYELESPNETWHGYFGFAASGAGDVNNDGYDDVIIGANGEEPSPGLNNAGRAYVFNGQTGAVIHTLVSPNAQAGGHFGVSVSGAGDVNNDGYDDVLIGASNEDPGASPQYAGRAYVFNGQTGTLIHTLVSPNEQFSGLFGRSVSGIGDANSDGYDDVVVGAHHEDPGASPTWAGRAYIFNGQTGAVMHTLVSPFEETEGFFGLPVSGAGDANDDGRADVIVGAYQEDPGSSPTDAGRAYIFNGYTGNVFRVLSSPSEEVGGYFGAAVSGVGDVNNNGYDDVIVGALAEDPGSSPTGAGRAYVLSGLTGSVLQVLESPNEEAEGGFGGSVSGVADVNSDGRPDVIVGATNEDPGTSPADAGRAYVFVGLPAVALWGGIYGEDLVLAWTPFPEAWEHWVYGADNEAHFEPGLQPPYQHRLATLSSTAFFWTTPGGAGDPDHNWTYLIIPVNTSEQEMCRSNRYGEHDFSTAAGP
jgi:hypothetical protein